MTRPQLFPRNISKLRLADVLEQEDSDPWMCKIKDVKYVLANEGVVRCAACDPESKRHHYMPMVACDYTMLDVWLPIHEEPTNLKFRASGRDLYMILFGMMSS